MFSQFAVVLTLSASVLGNVFVTAPVATTTWNGGQKETVTWQDSGTPPTLQAFGPSLISIYVGNALQQTLLQSISTNTDVSKASSVDFTVNPAIGPNGNNYFIRFESLGLKDATSPQFPALAFSAKFTLAGMTGTFNSSVQAQIDGQSTAPIGGSTSAPAATTPAATTPAKTTAAATSAAKTTSASTAKSTGAAMTVSYPRFAAVAAAAAALVVAL